MENTLTWPVGTQWIVPVGFQALFPNVSLWAVDLDHALTARDLLTLDAAEHAHANRLVYDIDRNRYRAAHCALRQVLSTYIGIQPQDIQFVFGPEGKPASRNNPRCFFNLSHSDKWALIGVSQSTEIGVDIEAMRTVDDIFAIASSVFSQKEITALASMAPHQHNESFLVGWTRKEACLKALGNGLALAPREFDAGIHQRHTRLGVITPPTWQETELEVLSFDLPPKFVGAVAQKCQGPQL